MGLYKYKDVGYFQLADIRLQTFENKIVFVSVLGQGEPLFLTQKEVDKDMFVVAEDCGDLRKSPW